MNNQMYKNKELTQFIGACLVFIIPLIGLSIFIIISFIIYVPLIQSICFNLFLAFIVIFCIIVVYAYITASPLYMEVKDDTIQFTFIKGISKVKTVIEISDIIEIVFNPWASGMRLGLVGKNFYYKYKIVDKTMLDELRKIGEQKEIRIKEFPKWQKYIPPAKQYDPREYQ